MKPVREPTGAKLLATSREATALRPPGVLTGRGRGPRPSGAIKLDFHCVSVCTFLCMSVCACSVGVCTLVCVSLFLCMCVCVQGSARI